MAAPLLALPFLSNPLVLGALAVIGTGAYLLYNKQDSLVVQADGLYSDILGFFISFSNKILKGIGEPLANVVQPFGMVLGVLLILLYSFKPPKQKSQISLVFGMNALVPLGTIKTL